MNLSQIYTTKFAAGIHLSRSLLRNLSYVLCNCEEFNTPKWLDNQLQDILYKFYFLQSYVISLSFTSFWVHFHVGLYICRGTKLITDQHLSYYSRDTYEVILNKSYI